MVAAGCACLTPYGGNGNFAALSDLYQQSRPTDFRKVDFRKVDFHKVDFGEVNFGEVGCCEVGRRLGMQCMQRSMIQARKRGPGGLTPETPE